MIRPLPCTSAWWALVCSLAISQAIFAGGSPDFSATATATATADDSDPRRLGWMQGAPPPADKLIMHPQSDYFSFPKLRWTVCHMRELLPTQQISRGTGAPAPLAYALDPNIDAVQFMPAGQKQSMTWTESLAANHTDGMLILHRGKIVQEWYSGCLEADGKHAAMSMTKSITGLLAEILVVEGRIDENAPVGRIVPELKQSAFGDATVRQLMDMTTSLEYSEDYANPNADIWRYSDAASPLPKAPGYTGPNGYFEYLQGVRKAGAHGTGFGYKTINTDALGWVLARVTGQELTTLLAERIWRRIGAEQDAYMTVDAKGTPFAGGGLSAGLRDLARLGQLMLDRGRYAGEALFPESVVERIRQGGDRELFAKAGYKALPGGSYRSMWWVFHNAHGAYAARGVHGQTLYIDPTAEMIIARFSSFPVASNSKIDPTSLPAYQAVAEYLMQKEQVGRD